jgi:hypothetical protein
MRAKASKKNTDIKEAKAAFEGVIEVQQVEAQREAQFEAANFYNVTAGFNRVTIDLNRRVSELESGKDRLDYLASRDREGERRLEVLEGRVEALYSQVEQVEHPDETKQRLIQLEKRIELERATRRERMDAMDDIEAVTHRRLTDLEGDVGCIFALKGQLKRWIVIQVIAILALIICLICTEAFAHSTSVTGELIDRRIQEHKANPEAWLKVETADKASSNYYKSLCYTDGCCVTCTTNSDCKGKECVECVREGCNDIGAGGRL